MEEPHTAGRARLTLVLGGARSGKSRHAQILAMATPPPWVYIATAQALDDEMSARIAKHKADRAMAGRRSRSRSSLPAPWQKRSHKRRSSSTASPFGFPI